LPFGYVFTATLICVVYSLLGLDSMLKKNKTWFILAYVLTTVYFPVVLMLLNLGVGTLFELEPFVYEYDVSSFAFSLEVFILFSHLCSDGWCRFYIWLQLYFEYIPVAVVFFIVVTIYAGTVCFVFCFVFCFFFVCLFVFDFISIFMTDLTM
jgi:hypothetical protein